MRSKIRVHSTKGQREMINRDALMSKRLAAEDATATMSVMSSMIPNQDIGHV